MALGYLAKYPHFLEMHTEMRWNIIMSILL